jgi:hypothetical protein
MASGHLKKSDDVFSHEDAGDVGENSDIHHDKRNHDPRLSLRGLAASCFPPDRGHSTATWDRRYGE